MKKLSLISFILLGMLLLLSSSGIQAQFLKNLKNQVKETVKQTVELRSMEKASNGTNNAIDKTSDAAAKGVKKVIKGDDNQKDISDVENNGIILTEEQTASFDALGQNGSVSNGYKSYDFVPGDKIIFQPDLSNEPDAELPARFSIKRGNAEIQSYGGEKILHLNQGGYVTVMPMMNNESYLPEQFTLELDMMYENPREDYFDQVNDFSVRFFASEDENYNGYGLAQFLLHSNERVTLGDSKTEGNIVNDEAKQLLNTNNVWHHIAIYVRGNIAKAYIGGTRVSATNNFPVGLNKLAIQTNGRYGYKIKNVRLAAGGDDKYNKVVTDGKFITHGITFDVNQSTIKPESMGALNEIVKLMEEHSDLNFEVNGHTDSDGNADANMQLSQARADAVRNKLIEMGIDDTRLTTKGNGATQPIDTNDTQEGKANNRRVEFVKI